MGGGGLGRQTWRKRPKYGWEDNIKMDREDIEWECVDWIQVAPDRGQWLLRRRQRTFSFRKRLGNSWPAKRLFFSRRTLLHVCRSDWSKQTKVLIPWLASSRVFYTQQIRHSLLNERFPVSSSSSWVSDRKFVNKAEIETVVELSLVRFQLISYVTVTQIS